MPNNILFPAVLLIAAFAPLIEGGTTHLPVLILQWLVISAGISTVLSYIRKGKARLYRTGLEAPLAVFILVLIISVIIAPDKSMAMTWVRLILTYALFLYIAVTAVNEYRGPHLHAAYAALLFGGVQAAAGLYQYLDGVLRVKGTFFNPNMMAGYLAACIAVAVSLALGERRKPSSRIALAAYSAALMAVILLSGSRGGALSAVAGAGIATWFRSRKLALLGAALLVTAVLVIPNPVRERAFSEHRDTLAYTRLDIWSNAIQRLEDHPMGLGLGNYKYYSELYAFPVEQSAHRYGNVSRTAHNEYLHFGTEMGAAGVFAMAYLLLALVVALRRSVKGSSGGPEGSVMVGAAAGVGAVLVHSCVDSNLHEPGTVFLLALLAAVGLGKGRPHVLIERNGPRRLAVLSIPVLLIFGIWCTLPFAAYQYKEKSLQASKEGKLYDALEYAGTAVALQRYNPDYHSNLAAVEFSLFMKEMKRERLENSLYELGEAERLNPLSSRYPELVAYVMDQAASMSSGEDARLGLLDGALVAADRAAALAPYSADTAYRKASILLELRRTEEAENVLKDAVELEPYHMKSRYLLARIYGFTGRESLSKEESRSIISDYERLAAGELSENERSFISVDIKAVRELAGEGGAD